MTPPVCVTCHHFTRTSVPLAYPTGVCQRYPPQIYVHAVRLGDMEMPMVSFPTVGGEDWCGEYKEKGSG